MSHGRLLPSAALSWLLVTAPAAGQYVRGTVVDSDTRTALAEVTVELVERLREDTVQAVSDSTGRFRLVVPRAGTYGLRVSHVAYATYEDSLRIATGEVVTLELVLGRQAVPLEPLRITARRTSRMRGFDERRRMGIGYFLTREDIEARRAARISELLRDVPGVSFTRTGATGAMIFMRGGGSRGCPPAIWLDGVEIHQYRGSTLDDILLPGVLEAVEVYTTSSGAPAQWVTSPCGVIAFWTRQGSGEDGQPWQWKRALMGVGAAILVLLLIR